jgi:glutamate/tyrosine decarboxylase-like PLP-dependent enzyme
MAQKDILAVAADLAREHLDSMSGRHVGGCLSMADLRKALGGPLPIHQTSDEEVLRHLAAIAGPGLVASPGPRYFGFVTGGAVPVAVAADWLVSAWDQNGALYVMSPAVAVLEEIVSAWVLEFLGLPSTSSIGFVTGAHMATFTCLAAARHEVLRAQGWNVELDGLQRAPRLTVVVGDEVHVSVLGALRLLGIGSQEIIRVPVDGQGRMRVDALHDVLNSLAGASIVCVQAGNVNTGASDPPLPIIEAAHARGAWVHVDGAFGLWAAGVPGLAAQLAGIEQADSWTTDAHKWLNVPYDSGLAIVRHPAPHRAAMSLHASYLVRGSDEERSGMDWVPESSRRARVVPIYALFRALGREGLRDMIARTCQLAQRMALQLVREPGVRVLNEVVLNQVLVAITRPDGRDVTREVIARVQAEGTCWVGGTVWQDRQAMRISVSNWSTTQHDIDRSAAAIAAATRELLAVPA